MIESLIKGISKKGSKWSNWAGNVECVADNIFYPRTEEEVVKIIQQANTEGKRIRVVGEGHSFSQLIETDQIIVSLRYMAGIISVDKENMQATVWAGTSINKANAALYEQDLALINLGDIDVQSLAGATATGTHGTGINFGNVSTEMVSFKLVTAAGEILTCSKDENSELFAAGRVSLGALGIITQMTLNVDKAYKLEYISSAGKIDETLEKLSDYNEENRNFEFYYFPFSPNLQLKKSNKTDKPVKNNKFLKYINDVFVENTAMQWFCNTAMVFPSTYKLINKFMGWGFTKESKIDYSHLIYATVRDVRFKEMEYNIPRENFEACFRAMRTMIEEKKYFVFFPCECRFVKGDDIWLSPAYQRDSAYIAVHVYVDTPHDPYFEDMEALFVSYGGRPHWGKMHTRTADYLSTTYEKWGDFLALREKMDPNRLFLNPHLEEVFGLAPL